MDARVDVSEDDNLVNQFAVSGKYDQIARELPRLAFKLDASEVYIKAPSEFYEAMREIALSEKTKYYSDNNFEIKEI